MHLQGIFILFLTLSLGTVFTHAEEAKIRSGDKILYGSWNIRWQSDGDKESGNGWKKRIEPIANVIRFHDFDIVGIQEGSDSKLKDLMPLLSDYEDVRLETNDHNPILLKKGLFEILGKGRFYLSETPFQKSKSWDSKHTRFCNWVELRRTIDSARFFVFNLHFDYHGKTARIGSSKMLPHMVAIISKGAPFIVAGDFNSSEKSEAYANLSQTENWKDARYVAEFSYQPRNSYNYFDIAKYSPWDFDHIFVSPEIKVLRYGILNEMYYDGEIFRFPSDHNPLFMSYIIGKN